MRPAMPPTGWCRPPKAVGFFTFAFRDATGVFDAFRAVFFAATTSCLSFRPTSALDASAAPGQHVNNDKHYGNHEYDVYKATSKMQQKAEQPQNEQHADYRP